jgi:hypothetical protein
MESQYIFNVRHGHTFDSFSFAETPRLFLTRPFYPNKSRIAFETGHRKKVQACIKPPPLFVHGPGVPSQTVQPILPQFSEMSISRLSKYEYFFSN